MDIRDLGDVNGPLIGIVMRYAVQRGMQVAKTHQFTHEVELKGYRSDGRKDWVTNADREAQDAMVGLLHEAFPNIGIMREETSDGNHYLHPPVPSPLTGEQVFFTIDPIDGTSAFKRMQSHGVACMLSLVVDHRV